MLMTNDYKDLKTDTEGIYSLSHKEDADKLSSLIKDKYGDVKIMDATSGIGGNSISFGKTFSEVVSVEINPERFLLLKDNLKLYQVNNTTINGNFLDYLDKNYELIFLDPPWGGPSYKLKKSLRILMNNKSLGELSKILKEKGKIIVWKLPFNYDLDDFISFNYQIHKISNYIIIIID
jgi:16S rRNA G966 N2-methylase RsmD